jgi:neutral ceramidase
MPLRPSRSAKPCGLSVALALAALLPAVGCGDDDGGDSPPPVDAGTDLGPPRPASTAHCEYVPYPATARAGTTVTTGPLRAGVAERALDIPVGTGLGAFTARGLGASRVEPRRTMEISGAWAPSVGIETAPLAKVVALTAGDETVVLVDLDIGDAYDGMTYEVEKQLGAAFHGKVLIQISHTHAGWAQFTADEALQVGFGRFRRTVFDRMVGTVVELARQAIAAQVDVKVGIAHEPNFDPMNRVSRDRRSENDRLPGGDRKDTDLFVIRIDRLDDTPLAILPIFGVHGTVISETSPLASNDVLGWIERAVEDAFEEPVMVMHLQGSGGDVSPAGDAEIRCSGGYWCGFAIAETAGLNARDLILDTWRAAEATRVTEAKMEMVTRMIELGPNWENFTIRGGALRYAPWDGVTPCDGRVFDDAGMILSPIDEFNAPKGAALCGSTEMGALPGASLPGTRRVPQYQSCSEIEAAARLLGRALDLPPFLGFPVCAQTRTMLSALRFGDYLFLTVPGEPTNPLSHRIRQASPVPPERTVVLGYAQGSIGYALTPEDWLSGGYEPNITFWGPLEGEYIAERIVELAALAMTDEREDAAAGGADHWNTPAGDDATTLPPPDPAPARGTVPTTLPSAYYMRDATLSSAQPPAIVERVKIARFTWIGEDPLSGTPRIRIERETAPGTFEPVVRRNGRPVTHGDFLLIHNPDPPVRLDPSAPRTHYWTVEWQVVTPPGTPGLLEVADRVGLPLGRYRFHVDGTDYALDSEAFEVRPASLVVTATRAAGEATLRASFDVEDQAYRMLDRRVAPNADPPVRGACRVELLDGASGVLATLDDVPFDGGVARINAPAVGAAVSVRVTDRFGNTGVAAF